MPADRIVLLVHYFPPINSSGAKRMEAMAKYFARAGRNVTVLTSRKTAADGAFVEAVPEGISVIEIDSWGRRAPPSPPEDRDDTRRDAPRATSTRRFKDAIMRVFGQLPDPRLKLALGFLSPLLARDVRAALARADVIVASCPPWPVLLAGVLARWRSGHARLVLDYRDQFSRCHEMPGTRAAKAVEEWIDGALVRSSDGVVAISDPMSVYYAGFGASVATIRNGYDPERIATAQSAAPWTPREKGSPLMVRYLGLITPGRVPVHLLAALDRLVRTGSVAEGSVVFEYYGDADIMRAAVARDYPGLVGFFRFFAPVPYGRALELIMSSDHLLMCENSVSAVAGEEKSAAGILTTKVFEYVASGRPVLADISPDTLVGNVIRDASADHFVADTEAAFERYLASDMFWHPEPVAIGDAVRAFSREAQALEYLDYLDQLFPGAAQRAEAVAA